MNSERGKSLLSAKTHLLAVLVILLNALAASAVTLIDPNIWKFGSFEGQSNVSISVADVNGVRATFGLTGGGWGQITNNDSNFAQIILNDTTAQSTLSIRTTARQQTSVGDIFVNGPIGIILAKTTDLRGSITVNGSVGKIELDDIHSNNIITIGSSANPLAGVLMKFDEVNDLIIDSNTPIKVLMCTQWLDNDANQDSITAPSLGTLQVRGDARRAIAGDFEASLFLDGSIKPQGAALVNAKIKGLISNHSWDITGDVRTLRAAGWFDANMVVDGNVASLRLSQLRGNIDIEGNARAISISEPMAVCAPDSGEIGTLTVGGQASLRSGRSTIRFANDTLYTSEPNMYRLEDLRRYDALGAYWNYTSTYRITSGGVSESGTDETTVSVQSALQNINGHDCYIVENCALDTCLSMGWYTEGSATHMGAWGMYDGSDELTLWMDVGIVEQEFLTLGTLYKHSGSFGGTLAIDGPEGTISGTFTNGLVSTSCKLLGHEQVTVPAGTYIAAKVQETIAMTGNMQISYLDYTLTGRFSANIRQIWWGVPEVGIVKVVLSLSERISIAGLGGVSVTISNTDQLTSYGP